jgi:LMBR1 domain-containing protein 1
LNCTDHNSSSVYPNTDIFYAFELVCICTLQIIAYMLVYPPFSPFLNTYFRWFDKWFPLLGAISVALFSMYLLLACVKGCFKFGLRLMWFTLHPMVKNGTYMNSFLFNVG